MSWTVKATCGTPELAARLKGDVIKLLEAYVKVAGDAGTKSCCEAAMGKVRVIVGVK